MSATDLFGNTLDEKLPGGKMCQRYIEPPFTTLDQRSGRWQDRKRDWKMLGMAGEVGRDERLTWVAGSRSFDELDETSQKIASTGDGATSIFDPVLCELIYSWFIPKSIGSGVLDPFAGGSVRGIVAARLGLPYTGVELRGVQVEANVRQALEIACWPKPIWIRGDSREIASLVGNQYDLMLTCPPYWNLERYSDSVDDLSTLDSWEDFSTSYAQIIEASVGRLKENRFAIVVVGNVRDKKGFLRDMRVPTDSAMQRAGAYLYNDFVLLSCVGSLSLRVNGQFAGNRKAGTAHQYALCYYKGSPAKIKEEFARFGDAA